MRNVTLNVTGMKCGGCAKAVEAALRGVEGVVRADVSLEEQKARLVSEDAVRAEDLVAAVQRTGYGASAAEG